MAKKPLPLKKETDHEPAARCLSPSWWGLLLFAVFGALGLSFLVQGFLVQGAALQALSLEAWAYYFIGLLLLLFAKYFKHR